MKSVWVILCLAVLGPSSVSSWENFGLANAAITRFVNASIHRVAQRMANISKENWTIDTERQEFGRFVLDLKNISVRGFENSTGEIIKVKLWPPLVQNLTIYVPRLTLQSGNYHLQGDMPFPISNKNITLSGSMGQVQINLYDVRASLYLVPKLNRSAIWVDESVIRLTSSSMTVNMENLMGGGPLGTAFNTVLNDSAIVAFNYFKDGLISYYKDDLINAILGFMCSLAPPICNLSDYYHNFIHQMFKYYGHDEVAFPRVPDDDVIT